MDPRLLLVVVILRGRVLFRLPERISRCGEFGGDDSIHSGVNSGSGGVLGCIL
jgi:hypothetical protein